MLQNAHKLIGYKNISHLYIMVGVLLYAVVGDMTVEEKQ